MRAGAVSGVLLALVLCIGVGAHAQQPASQGQIVPQPGWQFNFAPYLWLPTANITLQYNLPGNLGGRLPTEASSGPGDYLSKLDIAAMLSGDARYGRFSVLTDLIYTRFSAGESHIRSLDFFGLPSMPIDRSLQNSVTTTLRATIWTLAGGYTVLQGTWGNLDLIAGFRLLNINAVTDFSLALSVMGPRGNGATFGRFGGLSDTVSVWNGIGGIRGRLRLAQSPFFIPYYFDIGAGGSQLTWQISSGIGYQTRWAAFSALYRYLSFEQGGGAVVKHLTLGGPMLMVNLSF